MYDTIIMLLEVIYYFNNFTSSPAMYELNLKCDIGRVLLLMHGHYIGDHSALLTFQ
jgi:hypothetical protein